MPSLSGSRKVYKSGKDGPDVDRATRSQAAGDLRYAKQAERIPQLEQALQAARRTGNQAAQGAFLGNLGGAYFALGDARRAIEFHHQSLALTRAIGDRRSEATALSGLGNAYADLGDARQALDFHQQRLALVRAIGDRQGEAKTLGNLGNAYARLGDARQAIEFYQQSLALARVFQQRHGDRLVEARQRVRALALVGTHVHDRYAAVAAVSFVVVGDRTGATVCRGLIGASIAASCFQEVSDSGTITHSTQRPCPSGSTAFGYFKPSGLEK
ncbi:MAG: hypothetical protein OHK0022_44510 [Roseiflexaceae bacterium]